MSDPPADPRFMRRALALARRGLGGVEPNPMVGCVLVRGGAVLGEGYHRRFGGPHAEVEALQDAQAKGHEPAGCDAYVTLEPCCHFGKTPPCADALIAARVGRVFAAMVDPFPRVAGGGLARLRVAGVGVEDGLLEAEARRRNEVWLKRLATGLPWVIAKWAQTLDGRIATRAGESHWISNAASREFVHELRGRVDAVVVGIGTVLADDPRLTARPARASRVKRVARRVVIDPGLRLPEGARLWEELAASPLTVAARSEAVATHAARVAAWRARGAEVLSLPEATAADAPPGGDAAAGRPRLALRPLLEHLASEHAAANVLVEGGASLLGAFFAQRLVDQALAFVAPKLLGDAEAVPVARGAAVPSLADARLLSPRRLRRFGDDVMLDYRVARDRNS